MDICKLSSKGLNQTLCIAAETHNSGLCNKDKTKNACCDADHKTGFYDCFPGTCCLWLLCCHFTGHCQTSLLLLATLFHLAITHPKRSCNIPFLLQTISGIQDPTPSPQKGLPLGQTLPVSFVFCCVSSLCNAGCNNCPFPASWI